MKSVIARIVLLFIILAAGVDVLHAAGEAVNGFPNWSERVLYQWTNRARSDPQFEMASCPGNNCLEATTACYPPMPPIGFNQNLTRAARFHSDHMMRANYFAHNSNCVIRTDINSVYPGTCDGSSSCACSAVGSTAWSTRISRFGTAGNSEIIARGPNNYDPNSMFYVWLYEVGDVNTCTSTNANGHRYAILKRTGAMGYGYTENGSWRYATGDFGGGTTPTKIVSGAHYPQQAASVELWANWYDAANTPTTANVVVDGVARPMSLMRGTLNNGSWRAVVSGMGTGCHRYYFSLDRKSVV